MTVGAVVTASAMAAQPCTMTTVIVNGVAYYHCGPTWYTHAYHEDQVVYVVVNPPPGH
jgi:hypothetical protein